MILIMIDIFYKMYPNYSQLLENYLENDFNHNKVFVAFTHQVRAIGDAFKDDFCMQKREWLV